MLLEVVIILLAIPVGFLIAYWANDELVPGRRWFKLMIILSIVLGAYFLYVGNLPILLTTTFILIVAAISFWKSFDKAWTKKRV